MLRRSGTSGRNRDFVSAAARDERTLLLSVTDTGCMGGRAEEGGEEKEGEEEEEEKEEGVLEVERLCKWTSLLVVGWPEEGRRGERREGVGGGEEGSRQRGGEEEGRSRRGGGEEKGRRRREGGKEGWSWN